MKVRSIREGNPFLDDSGEIYFVDLEDYTLAVARGAKIDYMTGANISCLVRLLYKNSEVAYHFDSLCFNSNQFSCEKSDIEWLISQIHSANDTLVAFVVTYVSYNPNEGKMLHIFSVGDKSEQVLYMSSCLDKHDSINTIDTDFSLLKKVFNPLLEELNNKHYKEYKVRKNKENNAKIIQQMDKYMLISQRKSNNQCLYCGGEFKGLFRKKCSVCGKLKDY